MDAVLPHLRMPVQQESRLHSLLHAFARAFAFDAALW
jgi:hypothetical protein